MGKLLVLNELDKPILEWDPADAEQTAIAAERFMTLQQQGAVMAEGKAGGVDLPEQVGKFNPDAEEILAIKNLEGG